MGNSSPPEELIGLMREAIERCALDLSGLTVLTEAASGAYAVTSVLAALSGARRVFAVARDSRYGSVAEVAREITALARSANVAGLIEVVTEKTRAIVADADIITNSGHLRPINREMIGWMKPTAVIPLMYEAWERRDADVDVAACDARGIAVAGTNERHPAIDVFSFLGPVAGRLLSDAGIALHGRRIVVLSDNAFRDFIVSYFIDTGAIVESVRALDELKTRACEAVLVAMTPRPGPIIGPREAELIANRCAGAFVAQFWGDIDRDALTRCGVRVWPVEAPPRGHQGIMLSSIGPEPVVRLQAGGLKVGEVMARARMSGKDAVAAAVASKFGQAVIPSAA
jgi:hypothetical protein